MKYTLRQLEVFLAVAHHSNITRAAENLAMSQSAASSALRDLENQFEILLFDRIGKKLKISEQGQIFRPKAMALLEQAQQLQREMTAHDGIGPLRIGATLTIGNYLAVGLMARFMEQHSSARPELRVANTATIAARVANFELDVGLIEGDIQHPELEVIPWLQDQLVLFAAPDHPLAQKGLLSDSDLSQARWIVREPGSGTRQAFDRTMHDLLSGLNVVLALEQSEAIKRAVAEGLGIGCLSQIALRDEFQRSDLVPLRAGGRDFSRQLYLVINKHKYRSEVINRWLALCQQPF